MTFAVDSPLCAPRNVRKLFPFTFLTALLVDHPFDLVWSNWTYAVTLCGWLDLNTQETTSSVLPSPNVLVCNDYPFDLVWSNWNYEVTLCGWLDLNTQETTSSVLPSPNVLVCNDFPLQRFMIPFPLNLFTQPTRPKREKKTRRGWLPNSRAERCGSWLWPEGFQPVPKTGMKWLCCQWEWESARDITPGQVLQVATQARRSHLSTRR